MKNHYWYKYHLPYERGFLSSVNIVDSSQVKKGKKWNVTVSLCDQTSCCYWNRRQANSMWNSPFWALVTFLMAMGQQNTLYCLSHEWCKRQVWSCWRNKHTLITLSWKSSSTLYVSVRKVMLLCNVFSLVTNASHRMTSCYII